MSLGYKNVYRFPGGMTAWKRLSRGGDRIASPQKSPQTGDSVPVCDLAAPSDPKDRAYLGIEPGRITFTWNDIKADLIVLAFVDVDSSSATAEPARYFQGLFRLLGQDAQLNSEAKFLAAAFGAQKRHTVRLKRKHGLEFPLLADSRRHLKNCLQKPAAPAIYIIRNAPESRPWMVKAFLQPWPEQGEVLDLMRKIIKEEE